MMKMMDYQTEDSLDDLLSLSPLIYSVFPSVLMDGGGEDLLVGWFLSKKTENN